VYSPPRQVFGLLGLLPQAISCKITIEVKRNETGLLPEFAAAISIISENSGNLNGVITAPIGSSEADL
jgi:hypothetical protein